MENKQRKRSPIHIFVPTPEFGSFINDSPKSSNESNEQKLKENTQNGSNDKPKENVDSLKQPTTTPINNNDDKPKPRPGDVTFVVEGHEISTFKAVMNVKSKLLAALIKRHSSVGPNVPIPLGGVRWQVFDAMLQWYEDEEDTEPLKPYAEDALAFAQKFQITDLKAKCEDILSLNVDYNTAVQLLALAVRNDAQSLKQSAIDYINESPTIKQKEEYGALLAELPALIIELS